MSEDPTRYGISRGRVSPDEQTAAEHTYQRERKEEQRLLAWTRQRGMVGVQAQRFLARARHTRQQAQQRAAALHGHCLLWCCGDWRVITGIPFTAPCCGQVRLRIQEVT